MKKLFTLVLMMMGAMTMMAQWQPSDMEATRLDKESVSGQVQMKTIRTDDGKIILTWLRWSEGLRYDDPGSGYYLHLQLFDANGNPQFGDEGIIVSSQQTGSSTTDYGLALAENGDIIMAYTDARSSQTADREIWEVYLYRYDQQGNPVWDADGVRYFAPTTAQEYNDMAPNVCVSGDNIYACMAHTEYTEAATVSNYQLQCFDADGVPQWDDNMIFENSMLMLQPCVDGDVYVLCDNVDKGLDALRLNAAGERVWADPVTIDEGPLASRFYFPKPECAVDADGGLMLTYRKLESFTGYQVVNHITADGQVLPQGGVMCHGSVDGDATDGILAMREDQTMVAWSQSLDNENMYVNKFSIDGDYMLPGDYFYGRALDSGSSWGYTPVKVIPQEDGWVVLYGNSTSWNGANFMVVKLDDDGETVWSKQICEDDFKTNGLSVVYDENYAYVFYTQEDQYDDNWNVIPGSGGMYVMCVDINPGNTAINDVNAAQGGTQQIFNIKGQQIDRMQPGVNIVRTTAADGSVKTVKVVR